MNNSPAPMHTATVRQPIIRVILADNHPIVRAGMKYELNRHIDMQVLGEAGDGEQTLQLARNLAADVLVLDTDMSGIDCVTLLQSINALPQPPRVLIVTAQKDAELILRLLRVGAAGYLLKDEEPATITLALRAVARGDTWISPCVTASIVSRAVTNPSPTAMLPLSVREIEVLEALAEGKDNQSIGQALNISERTVRFHLRNIYDKLNVRRSQAIVWWLRQKQEVWRN